MSKPSKPTVENSSGLSETQEVEMINALIEKRKLQLVALKKIMKSMNKPAVKPASDAGVPEKSMTTKRSPKKKLN